MKPGKLIVFEGVYGAGKATQTRLLSERFVREGVYVHEIEFPRYGNPFAEPARLYLNGALGTKPGDVGAYAASTLYAVDRFASYLEDWGDIYEAGGLILADRYTTSNAVHQAAKLPPEEREDYLAWLFDFEYKKLGLPAPDLVVYLDIPSELSDSLLRRREAETGTTADIHEQDAEYLRQCREAARSIACSLGWQIVRCALAGQMRTQEAIHREVWGLVRPVLEA